MQPGQASKMREATQSAASFSNAGTAWLYRSNGADWPPAWEQLQPVLQRLRPLPELNAWWDLTAGIPAELATPPPVDWDDASDDNNLWRSRIGWLLEHGDRLMDSEWARMRSGAQGNGPTKAVDGSAAVSSVRGCRPAPRQATDNHRSRIISVPGFLRFPSSEISPYCWLVIAPICRRKEATSQSCQVSESRPSSKR
jgi:hypothetical protein